MSATDLESLKRDAAEAAIEAEVRSGMVLGLGTGSTARWLLEGLAARLGDGRLAEIVGIPTSEATAARCRELGIPLTTLDQRPAIDLAVDGADEVAPGLALIKGMGGAHLREKVVACAAARFVVVADETKLGARVGARAPLPVEVFAFARPVCVR
ncbi:MAG: ribose 5-phosphate isomerase, partial [Gaiellales bacterium]|nr:ribose 5-phosphate isomerase [Gaiellales bacterium]